MEQDSDQDGEDRLYPVSSKKGRVSPKVARPKLPTFSGSRTLGHPHRSRTDPGKAEEIKTLMEEIRRMKDGSVFDKTQIRPKVIKRTVPKARSTHTSPRTSPPPGSPPGTTRSSSLNRNRSKSLKLLTDKLKSGRGVASPATSSPARLKTENPFLKSYSADSSMDDYDKKKSESNEQMSEGELPQSFDDGESSEGSLTQTEMTADNKIVLEETIPEGDERFIESPSSSEMGTKSDKDKGRQRVEIQFKIEDYKRGSPKAEDEGVGDSDDQQSGGSFTTLHPIDMNSEFLRLRQTAPKRRPGYAGLPLPKSKVTSTYKTTLSGEEKPEDQLGKKGTKAESGAGVGPRKISGGARFITHPPQSKSSFREAGPMDTNGFGSFRSPSTESPPPFPGELEEKESEMSLADSQYGPEGEPEPEPTFLEVVEQVVGEGTGRDGSKVEKRNGKTAKQKSKSDPSGNKSLDFQLPDVIKSSSQSVPLLSAEERDEPQGLPEETAAADGELWEDDSQRKSVSCSDDQQTGKSTISSSLSEEVLSPQSEISDAFEPVVEQTEEQIEEQTEEQPAETEEVEVDESALSVEGEDGAGSLTSSVYNYDASATSTPNSQSPSGTLERPQYLLSVPSPKRPILRSASSASVLQRERKHSGGSCRDPHRDLLARKHSITVGDESAPSEKPMDFIPIGEVGGGLASSMPAVWNAERRPSESPDREGDFVKDKRYHIVEELVRNEKEYVDALKMLKEKYMVPLKTLSNIDETVIDNIFYMIPEILTHHCIYLDFLNEVWTKWKTDTSTVGDIIQKAFSRQTVVDSYLSFVENYKSSGKVIENALNTKSSVQKFIEQCQKESGSKLTMKDLIVRPIQRIPRYELLLQRLLDNTPRDHPDYVLLKEAEKVMHEFAMKIGHANETQTEEGQQETLKKLELLLMTDLAVPDRTYLRHDMVQIMSKKDQCGIWMFSDLIIISSVKRKSGPVTRKVSVILKSPTGQDFAENVKQKVWLRVGLDNIEILKSQGSLTRKPSIDKEQVEEDLDILAQIQDLSNRLSCNHLAIEEVLHEMEFSLRKQLSDHHLRCSLLESNKMELQFTTQEGIVQLECVFSSAEKRISWETAFNDAKQKLSLLSDKRAPDFLQALQITKTRAGMQFSCAAPIDGLNATGNRDVWVCNSDGYVGHMCLLSLQPEPIVTLNTPVPGCNARILCIGAVPASNGFFRRKSSAKKHHQKKHSLSPTNVGPQISVEEVDSAITEEEPTTVPPQDLDAADTSEEGYQSDSESSDEFDEDYNPSHNKLFVDEFVVKRPPPSDITQSSPDPISQIGNWSQDPLKSTMWLGTEDGCIHIFQCSDNIKTTKNKLKIQLGYPIYCIVYFDNKVFVSLANGDLIVYRRDSDGLWDTENPYTRTIGSVTSPIVKMLPVAGKLWCGCQNYIKVINPLSLNTEESFPVHSDSNKNVQCIVSSGQGVWIAAQQSSKVSLYHATTYEFLLEVSIAAAVNQKLQSADDIIRQHKAACLRITALLVCKDLLWVGTSAGVVLTIPMPKITSTTIRNNLNVPQVTGLVYGHTGHVRFLTCVELTNSNPAHPAQILQHMKSDDSSSSKQEEDITDAPPLPEIHSHRRSSMATMTATLATRMLVISGGDGYEDFRNNASNEAAGRDDSTNHLLLWQV